TDMTPQHFHPEYADQTTLSPLGAAILLTLSFAILFLNRRLAAGAFLASACFISDAQRIAILTADLTPLRVALAAGLLRAIARSEYRALRWGPTDTLVTCYLLVG